MLVLDARSEEIKVIIYKLSEKRVSREFEKHSILVNILIKNWRGSVT